MNKIFKKSISTALSFLMLTIPFYVFAETESPNLTPPETTISPDETAKDPSLKNKIEENNGIITINGEPVHYVPDSKIKISSDYINASDEVKFVKPEELSSEEIVCQLFPEGSPRPTDVRQGAFGICLFLSIISGLSENNPAFIKENLIEYNNDFVIVKFFDYYSGSPIYVMVQKTIPDLLENEGAFLSNNCLWVHMYLKAYVAMNIVIRKIDSIDYENSVHGRLFKTFWDPQVITGKEVDMVLSWWMEEEQLYKKIKEALEIKGVIICVFNDSMLCQIPVFKYFFNKIKHIGLVESHAYSVSQVHEDKNGVKWVRCRNPWGYFVPAYDKGQKLYVNNDKYTDGYFWFKLKDFHKHCDRIYFSTEKNITNDSACK